MRQATLVQLLDDGSVSKLPGGGGYLSTLTMTGNPMSGRFHANEVLRYSQLRQLAALAAGVGQQATNGGDPGELIGRIQERLAGLLARSAGDGLVRFRGFGVAGVGPDRPGGAVGWPVGDGSTDRVPEAGQGVVRFGVGDDDPVRCPVRAWEDGRAG